MDIKNLDEKLIYQANSNSHFHRGDTLNTSYLHYVNKILSWDISDNKKHKILDLLYTKFAEILRYDSQHVPVNVAGPANYNSKKLDKSDKILELNSLLVEWFKKTENSVEEFVMDSEHEKNIEKYCIEQIFYLHNHEVLDPTIELMDFAYINNEKFICLYEQLAPLYNWRRNSKIYKIYSQSKNGKIKEVKKEIIYEDDNLRAFTKGERAYMKFLLQPKRQLWIALKSRGWWWNSHERAYSTYLDRVDLNWITGISDNYSRYI